MQTLFTGDVVKYVGLSRTWKKEVQHIIHECRYKGEGNFSYSTNRGAWFKGEDFVLIQKATRKTLKKLDKDLDYV